MSTARSANGFAFKLGNIDSRLIPVLAPEGVVTRMARRFALCPRMRLPYPEDSVVMLRCLTPDKPEKLGMVFWASEETYERTYSQRDDVVLLSRPEAEQKVREIVDQELDAVLTAAVTRKITVH